MAQDDERMDRLYPKVLDTDKEFQSVRIESVETRNDGWLVTRSDGFSLHITNDIEKVAPIPGETMTLYGRGIKCPVRGIVISGRVYRYEAPW